jgi:ribosomal protein RSM22 (predicted rRNA methylase)
MYFSIIPVYDRRNDAADVPIVSEDDLRMHLPERFATAIAEAVSRIPGRDLMRAAETLSERYRGPGSLTAPPAASLLTNTGVDRPLNDAERAAYLVVRAPATFAAVTAALEELRERRPELSVRRVLDLGAGPGVASWAALATFDEVFEMTLVERDRGFAALGREILDGATAPDAAAPNAAARDRTVITWKQADLGSDWRGATYDLVLISYAIGELIATVRTRVLDAAWRATAAGGALVIVEPGTPRHFQGVLDARAWLLTHGAAIAAPCPHAAPCPMAAAGDWCHFSARVPRTKEHRRLKAGSLSYEDEKFSYVIATRSPSSTSPSSSLSRIVRHPYVEKGRITLTRCTAEAAIVTTPVSRHDREAFKRARKARWGDVWSGGDAT